MFSSDMLDDEHQNRAFSSEVVDFQIVNEPLSRVFSSEIIDFQMAIEPQNRALSSDCFLLLLFSSSTFFISHWTRRPKSLCTRPVPSSKNKRRKADSRARVQKRRLVTRRILDARSEFYEYL